MDVKTHWEQVYETGNVETMSWFQEHSALSFQLIQHTGVNTTGHIIDVGGGASALAGDLLDGGYQHITVLDISAAALRVAQERLGSRVSAVTWIEADITQIELPDQFYDVWHDRAVFHFLQRPEDRQLYVSAVRQSVKSGGHVIVAAFAADGPDWCSGLEVVRYQTDSLHAEFGAAFQLLHSTEETHRTPDGTEQRFIYCHCRKK